MAKKFKIPPEEIQRRAQEVNPRLTLDFSTYINTKVKARFIEEGFGDFWATPAMIMSGNIKGHRLSISQRRKETFLKNHGVDNNLSRPEVKEKIKQKNIDKYGYETPFESKDVQDKVSNTFIEKIGVPRPLCLAKNREKAEETRLALYGVRHPLQDSNIKEKVRQSMVNNHGVDWAMQSPKVRQKAYNTNLEKYGVQHTTQRRDIVDKIRQTWIENGYISKPEKEVKDFIQSLGVKTEKRYMGGNPGFEIDIVCPDLGVAFEFNGDYWHSEINTKQHPKYHLMKTQRCKANNIELIHIFESEWVGKKEIVQDFIKSKLGRLERKFMARKLQIREVSAIDTKVFFNKNHLQGAPRFWKTWGLYQGDELVAAAAFSKPHRQNIGCEPHLSRFACALNTNVSGGLSRLCSHAFKQTGSFVSYVHLRLSNGNSYLKAGFKEVAVLPPDYWYWDKKKKVAVSKQSRKKNVVHTPQGMTEKEHATLDGLYRIWDCGKKKYRYSRN